MWVRNIIWFILLIGIVVFSILLFLLVMDPIPDYTEQAVEQTVGQREGGQEAGGGKEGGIDHNESTSSVKQETEQQTHEQSNQQSVPAKTVEADKATADHQSSSSTEQKKVIEKEPPAENAGGKNETGSIWYAFGQGVGYAALFALLIPYMLFLASSMRGSSAFRRLGRTSAPAFSFFSLMGIAVAALHGGMMLRLVEPWNRHLLGGVWLFVFIIFFLLRASLYNSASPFAKGNPFTILTVLILLLFVIHSLG
ncbi:hypothetical protein [Aneurinibacillus sp. REN35]|uniref:hypothetical protein n=1 Tax=Aneurinibacillus sp. REN35 TaxID=3237286 RepID=UPI003529C2DB